MADSEFEETKEDDEEEQEEEEFQDNKNSQSRITCFSEDSILNTLTIPVAVRLTVKRNTSIDVLRKKLPIPKEALPVTSLPAWHLMPLDQKIPNVLAPAGAMILARGSLGKKLQVRKQENFVNDPCQPFQNQKCQSPPYQHVRTYPDERVLDPYNSLHDPHMVSYLNKPCVRKILMKQGLITADGKVLCSLKQFNKYRNHLRTVYNQGLEKYINENYMQFKQDNETIKKIEKYDSDTAALGHNFIKFVRRQKALEQLKLKRQQFLKSYEAKQEAAQQRHQCILQEKLRARMNRCMTIEETMQRRRERVCLAMNNRIMKTQNLKMAVIAKDEAVKIRLENGKKYVLDAYQHFVTQWLLAKWDFQLKRLDRDDVVRHSLEKELEAKAMHRLSRVERYRQLMVLIQARRKDAYNRLWRIVRKYFIIWRDKVRARKAELPDEKHQSSWDIHSALETTNKFMQEKTGGGHFNKLVTNILKLKSTIHAQLKKEEEMHSKKLASVGVVQKNDHDEIGDADGDDVEAPTEKLKLIAAPSSKNMDKKKNPDQTSSTVSVEPKSSAYASKTRSRYISTVGSRSRLEIGSSRRMTLVRSSKSSLKETVISKIIKKPSSFKNTKSKPSTPQNTSTQQESIGSTAATTTEQNNPTSPT